MGMIEARDGPGLPLESGAEGGIRGQVLGEYLQRDLAFEARVPCPVHLAHPPRPQRGYDFVGAEFRAVF